MQCFRFTAYICFLKKHIMKRPETESTLVGVKRLNNFLFFNLYVSMPHKLITELV